MFCSKCGKQNSEGASYCIGCGSPLGPPAPQQTFPAQQAAPYQQQAAQYPQYAAYGRPAKKRTGLIIGIIAGVVVIAGAVVALLLLLNGGSSTVAGFWYSEERTEAIEFNSGGGLTLYPSEYEGTYTFDSAKGEGTITLTDAFGAEFDFTVEKDKLNVEDIGEYIKAGGGFDLDEYLEGTPKPVITMPDITIPTPNITTPTPNITAEPVKTPEPTEEAVVQNVADRAMTIDFYFGSREGTYSGELLDGLPEGYGSFTSVNSEGISWTYEGYWSGGHFNGQGETVWGDEFSEQGEYMDDYLNGQGSQYWHGRIYYSGEYLNSIFNGQGTLYNYHGSQIYSGEFSYGRLKETSEQREQRDSAFKAISVPATVSELYDACDNDYEIFASFDGEVLQVYEQGDDSLCEFLMYESGTNDTGHIISVSYILSEGEQPVAEGDRVAVWGTPSWLYSYTSVENEYLTVPSVDAWIVDLIN